MKTLTFLILFLLYSCGSPFLPDYVERERKESYFSESDPMFDELKKEFEKEYYFETGETKSIDHININLSTKYHFEKNPNSVGVCYYTKSMSNNEILINANKWYDKSDICKKFIIYHELGHCSLGRSHVDTHLSVMNPTVLKCSKFGDYYSLMINEFFLETKEAINALKGLI